MKLNKIMIAVASLLACTALYSQDKPKNELSVWVGGGLSALNCDMNIGDSKMQPGGMFGVGYNYYFSENFSFNTGLELSLYNTKLNMDGISDAYDTRDDENEDFQFQYKVGNYEEKVNTMFLNIPLMIQFQKGENHKFYVAAGGKIGIPVSKKYKTSESTFTTQAYYADLGPNAIIPEPASSGWGTFTGKEVKGDVDLNIAIFASIEGGMKWELSPGMSLYTGVYFDYGLNDISQDVKDKNFLVYNKNNPTDYEFNSALESQFTANGKTDSFTEKITPMAVGIKLRLAFGR